MNTDTPRARFGFGANPGDDAAVQQAGDTAYSTEAIDSKVTGTDDAAARNSLDVTAKVFGKLMAIEQMLVSAMRRNAASFPNYDKIKLPDDMPSLHRNIAHIEDVTDRIADKLKSLAEIV